MIYFGVLSKRMLPEVMRPYRLWMSQRDRCNNPNNPWFRNYGAKGIKVEYTSREFIGWWMENFPKFTGNKPDVGRIDHDLGYSLDNINIEEHAHNVSERNYRLGNPTPRKEVVVFDKFTMEKIGEFSHTREAAKAMGTSQRLVVHCCLGKSLGTKSGLTFRYKGA